MTATNAGTQIENTVVTGADGAFTISNLPVGSYDLTAEAPGFAISHSKR